MNVENMTKEELINLVLLQHEKIEKLQRELDKKPVFTLSGMKDYDKFGKHQVFNEYKQITPQKSGE